MYTSTHDYLFPASDESAESFSFAIDEIRLQSGGSIRPQRAGVTAIVGANNAGKSTILRELRDSLATHPHQTRPPFLSVESVTMSGSGLSSLTDWLLDNSAPTIQGTEVILNRPGAQGVSVAMLQHFWQGVTYGAGGIGDLHSYVCFYGNAEARLSMGASAEMRDSIDSPAQHPIHHLEDDLDLRAKVSDISARVFRKPLTLDALARRVRLRVGSVAGEVPPVDNVPRDYRDALAALPPLDEQGDGMRGFFSQILPVVGATYPLVLLDEPEAFLHPPQAHALGVELGKLAIDHGVQILVATHDRNLLTGLLDSEGEVSVVRVSRDDSGSSSHQLDSTRLKGLWADPVLRYSNILDGLFHRTVVLAEAEGDCAFLSAALDYAVQRPGESPQLAETLFVATGGKHAMAKVATALRGVAVPVVAAPDLDLIASEDDLKKLVEALGAEWTAELSGLWTRATNAQRSQQTPVKVRHISDAITAVLGGREEEPFTSAIREDLVAQIRTRESPWAEVKKHGVNAFVGEAREALVSLLDTLQAIGVVLVRAGELERLAPAVVAKKGPGWLQEALQTRQQENAETQEHLSRIMQSAASLIL